MSGHFLVKIRKKTRLDLEAAELTVGTHSSCDLAIADPIAALRHCRIDHDGWSYGIRDLRTSTGTFVNGRAVKGRVELGTGDEIVIGTTRLGVSVDEENKRLELQLQAAAFHFEKSRSGEYRSDPDRWARAEVAMGRWAPFRWGNLLALAAVLIGVPLVCLPAFGEPLFDPGPLTQTHARLFDPDFVALHGEACGRQFVEQTVFARENGCSTCHSPLSGTPMSKCSRCHEDLMQNQHPFPNKHRDNPDPRRVTASADDNDCNICHVDHRGGAFVPKAAVAAQECTICHSGTDVLAAGYVPKGKSPAYPLDRRTPRGSFAFAHADHVPKVACTACHERNAEAETDMRSALRLDEPLREDFGSVPFETCAKCHVRGADSDPRILAEWRPKAEHVWAVRWHGTEEAAENCAQCHTPTDSGEHRTWGPGLRSVERNLSDVAGYLAHRARYEVPQKSHAEFFARHSGGRDCTECHKQNKVLPPEDRDPVFWHALHVDGGILRHVDSRARAAASAQCAGCHADLAGSDRLAAPTFSWPPPSIDADETCGQCHKDGARGSDGRRLVPTAVGAVVSRLGPAAPTADFPHRLHTDFASGGPLADGCFACHEFATQDGLTGPRAVPTTKAAARDCRACHAKHDHIGGGACDACHPSPDGAYNVYLGARPPAQRPLPTRPWPKLNSFSHYSRGHVDELDDCSVCHTGLDASRSLEDLPVPTEADASCRDCHLQKRERFHWR